MSAFTDNVVPIRPEIDATPGEPHPDTIAALRELLAQAEAGQLAGIVFVAGYSDLSVRSDVAGTADFHRVLGELGLLTRAIQDQILGYQEGIHDH